MFRTGTQRTVAGLVLGVACLAAPIAVRAAEPVKLSGAISGLVVDNSGIPQMGATVLLLNKQERLFEKVLTDDRGQFRFASLFPDVYSVRVMLTSFVPAIKKDILVQPGMRSVLRVNLSSILSTVQISYPAIETGNLISDEWKWVLRSASATRPVMRFIDPKSMGAGAAPTEHTAVFSDTRGMLRVSAGEGGLATGIANEADMGTAFALATSLYGNNLLQVSGNVGYGSQTGVPSAAFRTSYSRSIGPGSPEVSVTMRQLFLPARLGANLGGNDTALPMLRSMSAGFDDHTQVAEFANLQYGFTMDSVTFLDRMNYFSPYARLTLNLGDAGEIAFAYTAGNARPDLASADGPDSDLNREISSLGMFPRISLRDGRSRVQRGEEYEMTYTKKIGSRVYALSAYREAIRNAALMLAAPDGMYSGGDILPDLFSGSSTFNAGDFQTSGYSAAVTQNVGEHVTATMTLGSMGAVTVGNRELVSNSPDELRAMIHAGRKHAASIRVAATSPWTGTHLIASYQWTADRRAALPGNLYSTQSVRPMPGLNLYVKQPIPRIPLLPWRMEATADLRNMLAQGYLPLAMANGQQLLLVEQPRSFRGGLSFIF